MKLTCSLNGFDPTMIRAILVAQDTIQYKFYIIGMSARVMSFISVLHYERCGIKK